MAPNGAASKLVRGLIFHPPIDPLARDRLAQRVLNRREADDCLWLVNGDQLSGRLVAGPAAGESSLFGLATIHFLTSGATEPLALDLAHVLALSVASAENDRREADVGAGARLGFRDGTCLLVRQVTAANGLRRLDLGDGLSLATESTRFRDEVSFVQPCGSSTVYLSDREPVNYRHVPFLDLPWPFGRDRNVLGGRLRQGHVFPKGLGMHSTSRLVFDLSGGHREFAAELALDRQRADHGERHLPGLSRSSAQPLHHVGLATRLRKPDRSRRRPPQGHPSRRRQGLPHSARRGFRRLRRHPRPGQLAQRAADSLIGRMT